MPTETRPWGDFTNLYDTSHTKVKTISVQPQKRLSLQSHTKRSEVWVVVKGIATIQIGDEVLTRTVGEVVTIPCGFKHRLSNLSDQPLEIIEVQTGSYFGEDDIVRYEDDFQRA